MNSALSPNIGWMELGRTNVLCIALWITQWLSYVKGWLQIYSLYVIFLRCVQIMYWVWNIYSMYGIVVWGGWATVYFRRLFTLQERAIMWRKGLYVDWEEMKLVKTYSGSWAFLHSPVFKSRKLFILEK